MMKLINNPNDNLMGGKKGLFIDEQVDVQLNTLERKLQSLQASFKGMTFDIGVNGGALDTLKGIVDWINEAVIGVQKLGDKWGGTMLSLSKKIIYATVAFQAFKKVFTLAETYKAMEAVMAKEGVRVNSLTAMINAYLNKKREEIALKASENTSEALNSAAIAENTNTRNVNNSALQGQILKIRSETAALEQNTAAVFDNAAAKKINNWSGAGFYGGGVPFGKQPKPPVPTGAIGAAAGAAGAGAAAMSGLGRTAALAAAGLEAMGGPIGILITGLTVLVPLVLMYAQSLGEEETATKKVTDAISEKINESEIEISKIQQQEHAATTLATAYNNLQKKIESGTMKESEATKAKEEAAEIEKTLSDVIGTRGQITVENGRIQIDSIKNVFKVEKEAVLAKLEQDKQSIISERNKTQEQVDGAKKRIEALKQEIEAQKAKAKAEQKQDSLYQVYYRKKAEYTKWQADKRLANGKISQEERDALYELAETYNETADNAPVRDLVKSLDEALSEVNKLQGSIEELDNSISDIDQRESLLKAQDVPDYDPGDANDADGKSKKSSSSDRGGYNNRYAQTDPVVNAINNAVKNIQSKLNDQIKELQRIQKKQGASKENTLAQDKAYEKAINAIKAQIEKARGHFEAGNSKLFNGEIMQSMRDNLTNEILSEAQTWLDTPYVMGGTTKSGVDCSAFVQNVLGQVGINLQRTADYQAQQYIDSGNFDTDLASAKVGDLVFFKDTYDAGPGVNSATHVGIVTGIDSNGNVQMINASSSNGVSYANVNSGFWGDHFYGVGHNGGMTGASIPFNEKLAEFLTTTINGVAHRITQEEWNSAGYEGQLSYIRAAKDDEANKSEERQALLTAAENELLGSAKAFKDATDALNDMIEQAADTYIKNINAEVALATRRVERKNNRRFAELGNGATETDKARAEVDKALAALAVYKDAMSRDASEKYKDTEQFKDFIDDFYKGQSDALNKQIALIEAQYNDAMKIIEHNAKMRDYGVDNTEDAWGQKRATDAYADLLTKRKALSKELADLDRTDPKYIEKHKAIQEELASVNKEIRNASTQHIRTIREGYNKLVQELVFDGKDFGEMLRELWVDLGRNAWDLLLTGKTDNPSFFAQLLGFGDLDKNKAEAQSNDQWNRIQDALKGNDDRLSTTNATLSSIYNLLVERLGLGSNPVDTSVPFSKRLGISGGNTVDTSVPFTKVVQDNIDSMFKMNKSMFDLNRVLKTSNSITQYNTNSENNLTNKVSQNSGLLNDSNNFLSQVLGFAGQLLGGGGSSGGLLGFAGDLLGGLFGGGGSAVSAAASIGMPSFTTAVAALPIFSNGGSIPKFATGGAPAGRIKGAGSGRSDSILAYLQDKDKFVWLSNGEYVINEKSAKALGYDTLDKLNGYATGGPLDTSITNPTPYVPTINPQVAQRTTNIYGSNKMTEYLLREQNKKMAQQNEMLKNMGSDGGNGKMIVLNTQASSADVLRALQENPRAVQAIMGQQRNMGFR